jgi:tRNA nucleotidyltransferase (CCA-adding enzyme)
MAIDSEGLLIDPFNGQQDLQNKILRHTTEAFVEDPVRVLRVARFLARYGNDWQIHHTTRELFNSMKQDGELSALVPERVWKETEKAMMEKHPVLYFEALDGLGIFPELEVMHSVPQPPLHHPEGNVFVHTMLVLQRAADLKYDLATRFAALTHDFGKPVSFSYSGKLHGHEEAGVSVIKAFCERLRVPNKLRELAVLTSRYHLHCHKLFELRPHTIYKMLIIGFNAVKQPQRFIQFLQACQCDAQGRGETYINQPYPTKQFAEHLLQELSALDTKAVVQEAIEHGKSGPDLGEAVRIAQLNCIKQLVKERKEDQRNT